MGRARSVSGSAPIAVLPMYDFPWTAEANDALWAAMAARLDEAGVEAPKALIRGGDLGAQWRDPRLVFGQTCGYPFITKLKEAVALIAAPSYAFHGCEDAFHRSLIIRRASDRRHGLAEFRGSVAGLNALDSNTGMNLFRAALAPFAGGAPFFRAIVVTGSHEGSVAAVAEGRADLAAIDCVSYALLERGRQALVERVAIVAESPRSPGLPFIASARLSAPKIAAVRKALFAALVDPNLAEARAALGLAGARDATPADYERVAELELGAAAAGYARLA
jgi:ABC-type phosphate/phosphonate transport system substrate-binding protein